MGYKLSFLVVISLFSIFSQLESFLLKNQKVNTISLKKRPNYHIAVNNEELQLENLKTYSKYRSSTELSAGIGAGQLFSTLTSSNFRFGALITFLLTSILL